MISFADLKPFTDWLHHHTYIAISLAFLVAFAESVAIVGTIVPGSITLTAVGVLIGTGVLPAKATLIAAILGAIIGDGLSFLVGYHYHQRLKGFWPFRRYPGLIARGEQFFQRHGGKSIFIGRFFGPVRSVLPLVAGMMRMSPKRYLFADVVSGIAWAPAYILPGILIGAATLELPPDAATRLLTGLLLALIVAWLVYWLICKLVSIKVNWLNSKLDKLWQYWRSHPRHHPIANLIANTYQPEDHTPLVLLFALITTLTLLIILTLNVLHRGVLLDLNQPVYLLLQSLHSENLTKLALMITYFGEKRVLLAVVISLALWFAFKRHTRTFFYWCFNAGLCAVSAYTLKHLINFPRPPLGTLLKHTASFPSGHTSLATTVFGFLAVLICQNADSSHKRIYRNIAIGLIALVAFSRIFIGMHWLTDILGGLLLGGSVVLLSTLLYQRSITFPHNSKHLALVSALSLVVFVPGYATFHLSSDNHALQPTISVRSINQQSWWQQQSPLLPLYRYNRIGQTQAAMNIQWAGDIADISKELAASGWQQAAPNTLLTFIGKLANRDKQHSLPIWHKLYRNRPPELVMTLMQNQQTPILVLRLWPSDIRFSDSTQPLWLGSMHYRLIWHFPDKTAQAGDNSAYPAPYNLVKAALHSANYKEVTYQGQWIEQSTVKLLLIKQNP